MGSKKKRDTVQDTVYSTVRFTLPFNLFQEQSNASIGGQFDNKHAYDFTGVGDYETVDTKHYRIEKVLAVWAKLGAKLGMSRIRPVHVSRSCQSLRL
jgi:hypothetical protein